MEISVIHGDITEIDCDAIVNAANSTLLGGGGVDGAIHRKAGPSLMEECKDLGGCPTGEARITSGYNLKARYVIHTVGPVWCNGVNEESDLLYKAYVNSLQQASKKNLKTIAFPNISTGIYRFPKKLAAEIAIDAIRRAEEFGIEKIFFVCFDEENLRIYQEFLGVKSE